MDRMRDEDGRMNLKRILGVSEFLVHPSTRGKVEVRLCVHLDPNLVRNRECIGNQWQEIGNRAGMRRKKSKGDQQQSIALYY